MEFVESSEEAFQDGNEWTGLTNAEEIDYGYGTDYYFNSYAHFGIHEDMIKDRERTETYRRAIMRNPYLFRGKVVLDVGCGTGILSFFAAQAGAKHVYAVDCADIIEHSRRIVVENGFQDRITLIKGKIEEIQLPVESVDIIISEWMGYFLLYESMLNSVIYARDKWLVPGGLLFPDKARIWIAAIEDAKYKATKFDFWKDVYGINMTTMRPHAIKEPLVDVIDDTKIISTQAPIFEIDLQRVTLEQLTFTSSFRLQISKKDNLNALVTWFEVGFCHSHKPITLSTSPRLKKTHWKQTIFYLNDSHPVDVGQTLSGSIAVRPNLVHNRELDIKISFNLDGNQPLKTLQFYQLR